MRKPSGKSVKWSNLDILQVADAASYSFWPGYCRSHTLNGRTPRLRRRLCKGANGQDQRAGDGFQSTASNGSSRSQRVGGTEPVSLALSILLQTPTKERLDRGKRDP